ncbi:hypothetical protein SAMN05444392_10873 [Seinonella peptonophila]|uniref:Uncharacterized protein n=1 Tax=Seinonella peptonophila TaxID=112248 RepID=A0A1M4Z7L4_9BACL|nr:hypothetical protein SAMN05444392_10873 [Seinonella peptonophila]
MIRGHPHALKVLKRAAGEQLDELVERAEQLNQPGARLHLPSHPAVDREHAQLRAMSRGVEQHSSVDEI